MLVSHKYRFIFTKTGKTAGTSIENYFMQFCRSGGEITRGQVEEEVSEIGIVGRRSPWSEMSSLIEKQELRWWNHMPAKTIKEQLGDDVWNSYFKFCTIRNPYDQVISAYEHLGKFKHTSMQALQFYDRYKFRKFISSWHLASRDKYTIDGELALDDYIRFESLELDLERICQKIGVPFQPDRLRKLKSHHRRKNATISRLYSNKARRQVYEKYAFEMKTFGYEFPTE